MCSYTQPAHDVVLTAIRRHDVALASVTYHYEVMCMLGIVKTQKARKESRPVNGSEMRNCR